MAALLSFKALFLLALQDYMKQEMPEIRYCDLDLKQLEIGPDQMGRYPVSFPCILLEFPDTAYDQLQGDVQTGSPVFMFRLAHNPYSSSNSLAPEEVKKKALYYLELENKLYTKLQGWDAGGICQPLTRTREMIEDRDDPLRVTQNFYNSFFHDDTAVKDGNQVSRPDLDVEFEQINPG